MAHEARRRDLARAVEAALVEAKGNERYQLAQREARNGKPGAEERAHPLEYDRNGFPAPQRLPSFRVRVRRLITGA
jgi:hypothetical protein